MLHETVHNGKKSGHESHRSTPFFQPKLTVNTPGDAYEQEADAVADQVMRMRTGDAPVVQRMPVTPVSVQRACAACESKQKEEEGVQRKETGGGDAGGKAAPSVVSDVLSSGGGQAMDGGTKQFMESRFGQDFSSVRIHTDSRAAESASAIQARAYTSGNNIVFGRGEYQPDSEGGKRLLAHELVHVGQQGGGIKRQAAPAPPMLQSPRFSGNATLLQVLRGNILLRRGSRGDAVRLIQQALIDSGLELPRFRVDGIFGRETEQAVMTFQRQSGLTAAIRDGIIGPTTMGWLDQRFATGSTTAGTTPGATTGCAGFKTVELDMITYHGSNRDAAQDLEVANTIFNQCCVKFEIKNGKSVDQVGSHNLLGGDNVLNNNRNCGTITPEQTNIIGDANTSGFNSRFRVFYVESIATGPRAYSIPPYCATGAAAPMLNTAVVSNTAQSRSLAHEFGHILLNSGIHSGIVNAASTENIMTPTNTATGDTIDATQCATIFANA